MGLKIDYFYSLTPRQFYNHQKGWSDLRDGESKERMIFTRRLMFASLAPWAKGIKEQDIWPFDFDNSAEPLDEATIAKEIEDTRNYWDEIDRRRNIQSDIDPPQSINIT